MVPNDELYPDNVRDVPDNEQNNDNSGFGGIHQTGTETSPPTTLGQWIDKILESKELKECLQQGGRYDKVTIAVGTEWIKCACGSLKCGIRFEKLPSSSSSSEDTVTITWDFFGGTDIDRSHVGDTFFWDAVVKAAPTITSQAWTEYVSNHPTDDFLTIETDEEEEEDEDDGDEYMAPHADYPDIFKSVLLVVLGNRVLHGGIELDNGDAPVSTKWRFGLSTEPITTFGMDLHGHTWTKSN